MNSKVMRYNNRILISFYTSMI